MIKMDPQLVSNDVETSSIKVEYSSTHFDIKHTSESKIVQDDSYSNPLYIVHDRQLLKSHAVRSTVVQSGIDMVVAAHHFLHFIMKHPIFLSYMMLVMETLPMHRRTSSV